MNKQPRFLIQFICLAAVFVAILLQSFTQCIEMKPLKGFDKEESAPVALTFKTYYDGSFQDYMTEHAKRNTGFREFFIRCYNQMAYSCFGKITNNNIVRGYDHELFLKMYLNDATGKTLLSNYADVEEAKAAARDNMVELQRLIDTLHRHGTEFLFVFCPTKTATYPEMMPKSYQRQVADFSLEEYYIELFKENGIPHIDFYHYFQSLKESFPYPLYPRTGTHWSEATIPFVADSIMKKLAEITDYRLPSITYLDDNLTTEYSVQDGELESSMNLLFPLNKPALPQPVFALGDTVGCDKPNLLVIGDSYFVQLRRSCFAEAFNHWDYWMYNRDVQSSRKEYNWKQLDMILGADEVLDEADIVLAVFTAPMYYNFMFGFTQTAQNLYQQGVINDEAGIKAAIQQIKDNPEWLKAVEEQAQQRGITLEENLRRNAQYYLDQRQNKRSQSH